mgnify:FL=1
MAKRRTAVLSSPRRKTPPANSRGCSPTARAKRGSDWPWATMTQQQARGRLQLLLIHTVMQVKRCTPTGARAGGRVRLGWALRRTRGLSHPHIEQASDGA